jgi:hypothetical protein
VTLAKEEAAEEVVAGPVEPEVVKKGKQETADAAAPAAKK